MALIAVITGGSPASTVKVTDWPTFSPASSSGFGLERHGHGRPAQGRDRSVLQGQSAGLGVQLADHPGSLCRRRRVFSGHVMACMPVHPLSQGGGGGEGGDDGEDRKFHGDNS